MLEATQTASGPSVFENARQWEGQAVNGTYRLLQHIASSDHSAVFITQIPGQNPQKVAIKLTAADKNADIQLARWKLAAKISHPHLLLIFEVGRCQIADDDLLFMVMEYADETLAQILPQRALSESESREMLKPTLEALAYLHENGFAHGRLKPANVMVVGEQLKLSSDSLCRTGATIGGQSGFYDPPEGSLAGATAAGDIWSLGVTLVESLTRHLPTWTDRLQGEPSPPEAMAQPFADVARHSLMRYPSSRWTVAEIRARLEQPVDLPRQQQLEAKPRHEIGKARKAMSNWLYAIPILAMLATVVLLASLLSHKPGPQPSSATTTIAPPAAPAEKKSPGHKERAAPRIVARASTSSVVADHVVEQVVPNVPEKALRTIHGKVRVNVNVYVDADGNVARAQFVSAGPSRYFANLAMEAARGWKFVPGDSSGGWLLQFVFENSGATVRPQQQPRGA